jgi:EAL domain-containing protein (putative c-di-GMP-specific phosphodiesterase class I)
VSIDWREAEVSGSVGIASFPEDGADVSSLMRNADLAMYQAKERGRDNFQFYSAELNELSRHRVEQEKRVRGAIERGELFLEYQPEIDAVTGRTLAVEALLRWRDPDAGVVLPPVFMPLAEEAGASPRIGSWVLDRALADLRSWRAQGFDLKVAVNLSARQLQQADLVGEVARLLSLHGISPGNLRLEITEPTLMLDSEAASRTVRSLKGLGVELAIDNFGTGYSSLAYIRMFQLDVLKIERSFVNGLGVTRSDEGIVQQMIGLSHSLGMTPVAEGVDTAEQAEVLKSMSCDLGQGYYYSHPQPLEAIERIIERGSVRPGESGRARIDWSGGTPAAATAPAPPARPNR